MAGDKTILIIDDEPDTRIYFSSLLEDNGYKTITAENGEAALQMMASVTPNLITLDVTMPEMSGIKFYRTMREDTRWKSIPIVIITGVSSDFETFISSRRQVPPPDGYIGKPIDERVLLELISKLT